MFLSFQGHYSQTSAPNALGWGWGGSRGACLGGGGIGTGNVVQWAKYLNSVHKALGLVPNTTYRSAHTCTPSTWGVAAGRSEVEGHPQMHSQSEFQLDYMRPWRERRGGESKRRWAHRDDWLPEGTSSGWPVS